MYDVVIIGAGVVGLSIARSLSKNTRLSVLVIEKEDSFGKGVSSRNSEVIHSGIYYKPNTLKAKYCVDGRNKLYKYCKQNKIWFNNCGKLVVSKIHQKTQIEHLYNNARENGVYEIEGVPNSLFNGYSFSFDNGDHGNYNVDWPDGIKPVGEAVTILKYKNVDYDTRGGAGIAYRGNFLNSKMPAGLVYLSFGFEAIYPEQQRVDVM